MDKPPGNNTQETQENLFNGDKWELPSNFQFLNPMIGELTKRLTALRWNDPKKIELTQVVIEAFWNALWHGNLEIKEKKGKGDWTTVMINKQNTEEAKNKKIYITLEQLDNQSAIIVVKDEGKGFKISDIDNTQTEDKNTSQRNGIDFMRAFADTIVYNDKGNEVTITKFNF